MKDSGYEMLEQVLWGGSLKDKLSGSGLTFHDLSWDRPTPMPDQVGSPGRDLTLKPTERPTASFPKKSEMKEMHARGKLLHFFANHELLAIETMALVLLKFKDAPLAFRQGVFRTLQDEQRHLSAYLKRMEEYGVQFGGVPLNLYFWNTLKEMQSPLDFVSQMSLTFEQANLDFALEYAQFFESEMDDAPTAKLLREVHDDEVKHVAHGWKWFQEWKDPKAVSDFEAYRKALPFPMTPRRARGSRLFAEQSRLDAGMTPEFVQSVKVAGGSRGRVPHLYYFNPQCEIEGKGFALSPAMRAKIKDLEPLILWLALEEDVVELSERPDLNFLSQVHTVRGEVPEIITDPDELSRFTAFDEFRPWGFSESAWAHLESIKTRVRRMPRFSGTLHREELFSKGFWKDELKTPGSVIATELELHQWFKSAQESQQDFLVKTDQSTSGRGHLRLDPDMLKDPVLLRKLAQRLSSSGTLVIEPFLEKLADFSVQYEIHADGRVSEFPPRMFQIDPHFQYQGALLGQAWKGTPHEQAFEEILKQKSVWREKHLAVIAILKEKKYSGPLGIDCMVVKNKDESLSIESVIEVNVRYTMGRVAQEIERAAKRISPFKNGFWFFIRHDELLKHGVKSFIELEAKLTSEHGSRFFPTTPAQSSQSTWTYVLLD